MVFLKERKSLVLEKMEDSKSQKEGKLEEMNLIHGIIFPLEVLLT